MSIVKKRLRIFFCDITCKYSLTSFFEKVTKQEKCNFRHCIQQMDNRELKLVMKKFQLEANFNLQPHARTTLSRYKIC